MNFKKFQQSYSQPWQQPVPTETAGRKLSEDKYVFYPVQFFFTGSDKPVTFPNVSYGDLRTTAWAKPSYDINSCVVVKVDEGTEVLINWNNVNFVVIHKSGSPMVKKGKAHDKSGN